MVEPRNIFLTFGGANEEGRRLILKQLRQLGKESYQRLLWVDLVQSHSRGPQPSSNAEQESVTAVLIKGGVVRIDPVTGTMRVDTDAEEEEQTVKQAGEMLAEIAASLKRSRKIQTEINSLKKKTQAILDKLQ